MQRVRASCFLSSLFLLGIISSLNPLFAITEAKWNNPEVQLGGSRAKILEILGKPDSIDSGTEIYMVSDSKEMMMAMVEYKDEKVSVLGQIFKPAIGIKELEEKMKAQGLTPLSKTDDAIVYFTKMPTSDLEYYISLNAPTEEITGAGMAKMTKDAFKDAEGADIGTEPASATPKADEKPSEKKVDETKDVKPEEMKEEKKAEKKEEKK